ncbi:MAG: hypothetical protein WCE79_28225 [Xanthobacteraceae bacterium]
MTSVPAATRLQTILIGSIALLAALFLVWPVWRAFFPMEIWGNEGWNAYQADAAMRGAAQLYPPTDGLIANNYPPLSYYVMGWLGRLFGDPLYVGRAVSILSTLAAAAAAAAVVRQFGGSRAAGLLAAFWFIATLARFFEFYVGMNEPQLFGLAVMSAGFAWFWKRQAQGRAVEPAVLVMVLAGFIKHNFITLPLVALLWLWLDNWRLGLRATLTGAAASALGLAICAFMFAPYFIPDMLFPRTYHLSRAFSTIGRLQFILPAMVLWAIWAWHERRSTPARFTALLIGIALPLCLLQKSGAGVDENAQFELIFATAAGIGLAYDGLLRDPLRSGWSPRTISAVVLGILIVRLLISSRIEFAYVLFSPQYRAQAAEHAAITRAEAARTAAIPGPVACSNLVVCRMAVKPFVYDHFWITQLVETGRMTWPQVEQLARRKAIVKDETDRRANITSLWRRMRSD